MTVTDHDALVIALPDAPPIPGLRFRHWAGPGDLRAMNDVANAARLANGDPEPLSEERMRLDYANLTNCDATRDVLIAEVDGQLVAYGRVWWEDRNDGSRGYVAFGFVHPAWRRRGIGWTLSRGLEARNLANGATHETQRPRVLIAFGEEVDAGNTALLQRAGYQVERRFVHMVRPTLDAIVEPPLPTGLEIRAATIDDARAVFLADAEAFADHWGATDVSDAAWVRFRDRPDLDPSLWILGWDGDEVAGGVLLETHDAPAATPDQRLGWLMRVFTRTPWRRRGLAGALIGRSLVVLRERGQTGAQLGVDVDNAQRALDLYRDAGFEVHAAEAAWSKPWPGTIA